MVIERTDLLNAFQQAESAVYFATADGEHEYFGFGLADSIMAPTLSELTAFQQKQKQPIFGGLPFFKAGENSESIMAGYFLAPAWVLDYQTGMSWGSWSSAPLEVRVARRKPITQIQELDEADWISRMQPIVEEMQADVHKQKVVLGMQRQMVFDQPLNPGQLIADLNQQQPQAYRLLIKRGTELFVSATPERLVTVNGRAMATAAVAGSISRGEDLAQDRRLASSLQHDPKNLAEHAIVVKMITDQLAPLADLNYPSRSIMLKTPQIQHLYTPIEGRLKEEVGLLDLVSVLHPTPALGGQPRKWALATIKASELLPRGLFSGPIGYMLPDGSGEFVVGIRSLWSQGTKARLFAGAGILAASDLNQEAQEIRLKMSVMMKLIKGQVRHGGPLNRK